MTTMTVCKLSGGASPFGGAVCVPTTCIVQTICVTGSGESFSNCNSTIASVSSKLLAGSSTTRRKTLSGGSQATFSFGCQSDAQFLATNFRRQRFRVRHALLAAQHKAAALRVELPEAFRVGREVQDVAGIPAGHVKISDFRFPISD